MDNNKLREKWIDEVLESTRGMAGAAPRTGLYDRVVRRMNEPESPKTVRIPVRQWAAAAVLLLAVNTGSVIWYTSGRSTVIAASVNTVASEIQSVPTYNY